MNLPNKLTVMRIALIPVFLILALQDQGVLACLVFIIASVTDFLDGYIARKYNLVSDFGKLMDPLADKLLVMSALILLVEFGTLPSWMVIVILAREFIISGIRTVAASTGKIIAASKWGKFKTIFQMLAIISSFLVLLPSNRSDALLDHSLWWIAFAFTVISGLDYIIKNVNIFKGEM